MCYIASSHSSIIPVSYLFLYLLVYLSKYSQTDGVSVIYVVAAAGRDHFSLNSVSNSFCTTDSNEKSRNGSFVVLIMMILEILFLGSVIVLFSYCYYICH